MRLTLLICLIYSSVNLIGQASFSRVLTSENYSVNASGYFLFELEGDLYSVSTGNLLEDSSNRALLTKYTPEGGVAASYFIAEEKMSVHSAMLTEDGHFLIGGYRWGAHPNQLYKVTPGGEIIWAKAFAFPDPTITNNFAVFHETEEHYIYHAEPDFANPLNRHTWVYLNKATGALEHCSIKSPNSTTFGLKGSAYVGDNTFIINGINSEAGVGGVACVLRADTAGTIDWQVKFNGEDQIENLSLLDMVVTASDDVYLTGEMNVSEGWTAQPEGVLVHIDPNGTPTVHQVGFGLEQRTAFTSIVDAGTHLVLVGSTQDLVDYTPAHVVVEVGYDGTVLSTHVQAYDHLINWPVATSTWNRSGSEFGQALLREDGGLATLGVNILLHEDGSSEGCFHATSAPLSGPELCGNTLDFSATSTLLDLPYGDGLAMNQNTYYPALTDVVPVSGNADLVAWDACSLAEVDPVSVFAESAPKTQLYPNPANGHLHVQSETTLERVTLLSTSGQIMLDLPAGGLQTRLDLTSLPEGFYLVQLLHTTGQQVTKRVAVRH